jgi:hypothetical protein
MRSRGDSSPWGGIVVATCAARGRNPIPSGRATVVPGSNRRADFRDLARILNLQAVERIRVIFDLRETQRLIGKADHLIERGHSAIWQLLRGFEAQKL